jgi:hypothetical protein
MNGAARARRSARGFAARAMPGGRNQRESSKTALPNGAQNLRRGFLTLLDVNPPDVGELRQLFFADPWYLGEVRRIAHHLLRRAPVQNQPTDYTDPSGEIFFVPLLIIGGLSGANIWIWGKNAKVADDICRDRPIDYNDTPYRLKYYKGLSISTAAGSTVAVAAPLVATYVPATVTTTVALGGAGNGVYRNTDEAIADFQQRNYFTGAFHLTMAGTAGYGGFQVARPVLGIREVSPQPPDAEFFRFLQQGYSPRQARDLLYPYAQLGRASEGNHFLPKRWTWLPPHMLQSPYNVMKPTCISRGRMYERHALGDVSFRGARVPGPGGWSRAKFMGRPYGYGKLMHHLNTPFYGMPDRTQGVARIAILNVEEELVDSFEEPD